MIGADAAMVEVTSQPFLTKPPAQDLRLKRLLVATP
jgi:hypothetical protein